MPLTTGTRLGIYEILAPLGAGGMGEVYRARDTKLGREVALKVLPEAFANDAERMARFEREAQTLASVSHPNLAAIYGVEETTSTRALVMELVDGPTLSDRTAQGPMPLDEAFPVARQIAEALEYAHEKGIVHRDLKPANVKMAGDGTVKLLDFGLAKALATDAAGTNRANSPTISIAATQAGVILGTAAYMAPEQAKGKPVDRRADIWAFGCVLFEMLTGHQLFTGETVTDVLAAVVRAEPEWQSLPASTPPSIQRLLRRCLEKDPRRRLQAIGEARIIIEEILSGAVAPVSTLAKESRVGTPALQRALPWAVVTASLVAAVALAVAYFGRPAAAPSIRALITAPENVKFEFNSPQGAPALSPDGARLVFPATDATGKEALWVRPLDSLSAQRLEGTEGGEFPFWSPDSRHIGYFQDSKLKKIDVTGGPPWLVCDADSARGGAWGKDVIIFAARALGGLSSVPVGGGTPNPVASPNRTEGNFSNRWPVFLPDGRHFLFLSGDLAATGTSRLGIYAGEVGSDKLEFLLQADSDAQYAAPGYLLFLRGETLMAQGFDAGSLKLKGEAFPVAEHVASPLLYRLGIFGVSQTGLLVYEIGRGQSRGGQLTWFDESGKELETLGQPGANDPWISPDGKHVAYSTVDEAGRGTDIWLKDLARGVQTRFSFGSRVTRYPVWSPDGTRVAYTGLRESEFDIFAKDASGAGKEEILVESEASKFLSDWSRDGRYILFSSLAPRGKPKYGIWVMPLFGDRKPYAYLQTDFNNSAAVFSPDGRWLAYQSDESGSYQIYLSPFPAGGGKWGVSQGGGVQPMWKHDGSAIYYLTLDGKLMEASIQEKGSAVEIGTPQELFQQPLTDSGPNARGYAVSPDGKRFLMSKAEQVSSPPLVLVTDWTKDLKR